MATTEIIFPEWRDENTLVRYPFAGGTTMTSTGGLTIPNYVFQDAIIYPVGCTEETYLSKIVIDMVTGQATLYISTGNKVLATGTFQTSTQASQVELFDEYGRAAGVLVSEADKLDLLASWSEGTHKFTVEATRFDTSVLVPMPQTGVRGIVLKTGEIFTGDIWLVGERGVTLRQMDSKLRVDIAGEVLAKRYQCQETNESMAGNPEWTELEFETIRFLQSINNVDPNDVGEFFMLPEPTQDKSVLRFESGGDGVLKVKLLSAD